HWAQRAVAEQPNASRAHHAVLLDHLHSLLWRLGRSLAESEHGDTTGHCAPAREHGEQRWEAGWSLSEVVRDYQILRLVLVDYLEKALNRPLLGREVMALGLALDEAITSSVANYQRSRDEHARQLERERAEQEQQRQGLLRQHAEALQEAHRRK